MSWKKIVMVVTAVLALALLAGFWCSPATIGIG